MFTSLKGAFGMRDLRLHAVLFCVAVVGAVLTWSREISVAEVANIILIWEHDSTEVVSVHYQTPALDLRIERRTDQAGDFLWGLETRGPEHADTLEFPVGPLGRGLVNEIANLRTLREMGTLSPDMMATLGFEGSTSRIELGLRDARRELILGDSVFGGTERYAYDTATGAGYVLTREVMQKLATGEGAVRERLLHHFAVDEVASVRVELAGRQRTMRAGEEADEWTETDGGRPDVAFGNFMQRVENLAIAGFGLLPSPGSVMLLRVDYLDDDGELLGFMELIRDDSQERDPYFVRSKTTRIPARAVGTLAQRVEDGVSGIF